MPEEWTTLTRWIFGVSLIGGVFVLAFLMAWVASGDNSTSGSQ